MSEYPPEAVPVRVAKDWHEETIEGQRRVVVTDEREPRNRLDAFLMDSFGTDRERTITLDEVGTTVWRHSDGEHTLEDVAAIVTKQHDEERIEPVEQTLGQFLLMLQDRDLLRIDRPG